MNVTFRGNELSVSGVIRQVGEVAPDFIVVMNDLQERWFHDFSASIYVLNVVTSLDTQVCDYQARTFQHEYMTANDVLVITISVDLPFAQARWCGKLDSDNLVIVSDYRQLDFAQKYGVLIDQLQLLLRAVFVIDQHGVIRYVEYARDVSEQLDLQAANQAIAQLRREQGAE